MLIGHLLEVQENTKKRGKIQFRDVLRSVYTKCQHQLCGDASDTALIENNEVTLKCLATPIWSDSVVFNENSIASVITELWQH